MQILQADRFPLLGKRLIEASAGTGKTYTVARLLVALQAVADAPLAIAMAAQTD